MIKTYFVEGELCNELRFESEIERNEMALALVQEHAEFFAMRCLNWYGEMVSAEVAWEAGANNVFTWERIVRFEVPTQVAFCDPDGPGHFIGGIGYGEEIICGCCGGVYEIADIYEACSIESEEPIVVYEDWVDISEEICGN